MREIPLFRVSMSEDAILAAGETLRSGYIGQGPRVEEFEALLRKRIAWPYLVTLNSGTSALHLAMRLVGAREKSVVVSTPLTCFASNMPILASGSGVVWADINPRTCNIDIRDAVTKAVRSRATAILVVHWGGQPVDVKALSDLYFSETGEQITIIEDCAHAFGASYHGIPVGASGNYCAFSFQAIKHLTTADGGMLCTPQGQYRKAKLLRWYGIDREEQRTDFRCERDVAEWGYKFHMNDVSAAIGSANLKHVDNILRVHRENARFYRQALGGFSDVGVTEAEPGLESAHWLFTIFVDRRDDFIRAMGRRGIIASRVHRRNDRHPCFAESATADSLAALDSISEKYCAIPVGWWVTPEDREYIAECIRAGW